MWEEIACGQTHGQRLTNYYIDNYYFLQDTKVLEAALRDAEVSQKDFLQRLFPSVKATEGEKHCDWLEDFASKANKWIEEQATATAAATG